ncbi:MAG TPA: exodeoxyribonuclease V subunit alpha [Desulfuromonadaceae bacterium]|jgi:exodeoxyribonuclease V alpha subunit
MTRALQLSPLDHHFACFINKTDSKPCDELWLAAALTSAVAVHGHVCLNLAEAAELEILPFKPPANPLRIPAQDGWTKILAACDTVGKPGDFAPLILDQAGRLYLNRSWRNEQQVAEEIVARLIPLPLEQELLKAGLDRYFPPTDSLDWQRVAATAALTRRFTVISGGPGTGKTATVARILALLIELSTDKPLITLAAPTGKAAMRLRQSILSATQKMGLSDELRSSLPDKVQTIHRLLGAIPKTGKFRHNRENLLKCDCLVVDEVSMVDLPLMARLLEALPRETRIILLGDRDQLASVEAGAVMADICNYGIETPYSTEFADLIKSCCGPLPLPAAKSGTQVDDDKAKPACRAITDSIIHLEKSYRFGAESGIGTLSRLINAGDSAAAFELLQSGIYPDVVWRPLPEAGGFEPAFLAAAKAGFHNYSHSVSPDEALDQLERFRVLSPHREGRTGVENLNRLTEKALGLQRDGGQEWCRLLPLMMTANNYDLGLFNGDTAVVMNDPETKRLAAYFPDPDNGLRRISPLRLPPHQSAFAMTVHKSQGSEFKSILLVLPEHSSEVLSRQLLYTAVTRASSQVEIWGTEEVFLDAVRRCIKRSSGLRDRLWHAA